MIRKNRTRIELGFYPISISYVKELLKNCKNWEYDNKATCKYVAENVIERIVSENPDLPIIDSLESDLISIAHNMNKGAKYLRINLSYKE
jgi:hypothetical protein